MAARKSFQSSGGPSEWGLLNADAVIEPGRFPIKWGPQRVGPLGLRQRQVQLPIVMVSNQVGAPASGAEDKSVLFDEPSLEFPIKWGPQRVGPTPMCTTTAHGTAFCCFQSSGGPSEWGPVCPQSVGRGDRHFGVSNQVGAPASGANARSARVRDRDRSSFQSSGGPSEWGLGTCTAIAAEYRGKFPIKWGPQRVGPPRSLRRRQCRIFYCFQSSGGPSEWGLDDVGRGWIVLGKRGFQSSGGPSEWGRLTNSHHQPFHGSAFPIKWGPQRVGPEISIRIPPRGCDVSNQVGAPASGASPLN